MHCSVARGQRRWLIWCINKSCPLVGVHHIEGADISATTLPENPDLKPRFFLCCLGGHAHLVSESDGLRNV